jgi:LuxR family transcriptional regulator, quorum-sensing system regulator SolR
MDAWIEEHSEELLRARDKDAAFTQILAAARDLGFDHCAYGLRWPLPIAKPRFLLINNYPAGWREQYEAAGYLSIDPTVSHGRRSQNPLIWRDEVFAGVPELWEGARSFGLAVGWAQSNFDASGVVGMLSLARAGEPITGSELQAKELRMRYLVCASHHVLSRMLSSRSERGPEVFLTKREIEILKWLADGKSSREISDILHIAFDTVNFHVKNVITKFGTPNKTAAVVRAVLMGLVD